MFPNHADLSATRRTRFRMFSKRLTTCQLLVAFTIALTVAHCGETNRSSNLQLPNPAPGAGEPELNLKAELYGRYIGEISIDGTRWAATGPGQDVALTFDAIGLEQVVQFELIVETEPANLFDFDASSFAPQGPFVTFGSGVEAIGEDRLRFGGANLRSPVAGDRTLGTLSLTTAAGFSASTSVRVRLVFFSIGPSSSERDSYDADQLNMGVVVNAR